MGYFHVEISQAQGRVKLFGFFLVGGSSEPIKNSTVVQEPKMHDPVLVEIIKNAMATIAEEIGIVAVRSAYSTAVKESADASAAVCDCAGQVIAQSLGAPLMHLSSLRWSPRERMKDGDVFLFNDQFRGGIHSNDIMVFKPVFSGGRPRFLTSALIHVADLGGLSAGGLP